MEFLNGGPPSGEQKMEWERGHAQRKWIIWGTTMKGKEGFGGTKPRLKKTGIPENAKECTGGNAGFWRQKTPGVTGGRG